MIMFNDFVKLNKLSIFFIGVLLAMFIGGQILVLVLIKIDFFTDFLSMNFFANFFAGMYFYLTLIIVVLLATTLFVTAVKTFFGSSREFILMHRGRNYYLKLQFLIISISALLISGSYTIFRIVYQIFGYTRAYDIDQFPPFYAVSFVINPSFLIAIITGTIALYYVVMYIIDIFANCQYRYQRVLARNMAVLRFMIRIVFIGGTGFYLLISSENIRISFDSSYIYVLPEVYLNPVPALLVMMLAIITVVLIVDYTIHFKKKVLV